MNMQNLNLGRNSSANAATTDRFRVFDTNSQEVWMEYAALYASRPRPPMALLLHLCTAEIIKLNIARAASGLPLLKAPARRAFVYLLKSLVRPEFRAVRNDPANAEVVRAITLREGTEVELLPRIPEFVESDLVHQKQQRNPRFSIEPKLSRRSHHVKGRKWARANPKAKNGKVAGLQDAYLALDARSVEELAQPAMREYSCYLPRYWVPIRITRKIEQSSQTKPLVRVTRRYHEPVAEPRPIGMGRNHRSGVACGSM